MKRTLLSTVQRLLLLLLLAAVSSLRAAEPADPTSPRDAVAPKSTASRELFETIKRLDGVLFDAFNAHNADALMSYFTSDLEFYQDNDGLKNFGETAADFKQLFASVPDIQRTLVESSLEVYPIKDHGAIEIGTHRFCHKENGKEECGTFRFAMVWRKTGDKWQISRVLSYGH